MTAKSRDLTGAIKLFRFEVTDGEAHLDKCLHFDNKVLIILSIVVSFGINLDQRIMIIQIRENFDHVLLAIVHGLSKARRIHIIHIWVMILMSYENYHICIDVRATERKGQIMVLWHQDLNDEGVRIVSLDCQNNILR